MYAKRLASGIIVRGILGVALLAGIGIITTAAEAGPKRERVAQRDTRKPSVARDRKSDTRQRRTEAVGDRRVDQRRVEVQHRSLDVQHRRNTYRHRAVRHRRFDDRCVVVRRVPVPVRHVRPWYVTAPRYYVDRSPFYFHAGLGVYLGGVFLNLELGDAAPAGYVYVDPYCGAEFLTIRAYRHHLHRHHHRPALRLVRVDVCGY